MDTLPGKAEARSGNAIYVVDGSTGLVASNPVFVAKDTAQKRELNLNSLMTSKEMQHCRIALECRNFAATSPLKNDLVCISTECAFDAAAIVRTRAQGKKELGRIKAG